MRLFRILRSAGTVSVVLAAAWGAGAARGEDEPRPNILLIMADDFGYECVGANGGGYETPRIDELAARGMRFSKAHAQPLCTPSRVQIMTGLYNSRNYIRFGQLDPEARTFAHWLKGHGYATAIAGKWQLDGGPQAPAAAGFDRWCLWQVTDRPDRFWGPGLEQDGEKVDFPNDVFGPDVVTDFLCAFMEENRDRLFFAYYSMIMTHDPFVPVPESVDGGGDPPKRKRRSAPENFPGFVSYADALVGKLIDKLDALGLADRTLVIFTGDNGTHRSITSMLNGAAYPGGKGSLRRNGTHVPFIVSWPGRVTPGEVSDQLVDLTDVFPTIAEAAGAALPEDYLTDGFSLIPELAGSDGPRRQWSACWYERGGDRSAARLFVHNHDFKLDDHGQFFDLRETWRESSPVDDPFGPVYDMLRAALEQQKAIAEAAAIEVEKRRAAIPPPTYHRKTRG